MINKKKILSTYLCSFQNKIRLCVFLHTVILIFMILIIILKLYNKTLKMYKFYVYGKIF